MRVSLLSRLCYVTTLLALLLAPALADVTTKEAAKFLPDRIGDFRAQGAIKPLVKNDAISLKHPGVTSAASRSYLSPSGEKFGVVLIKTNSDSQAFAVLTSEINRRGAIGIHHFTWQDNLGTAAFADTIADVGKYLAFYKGATVVGIFPEGWKEGQDKVIPFSLAQSLADSLDSGSNEIPVLVKHLPDWETAKQRAFYALTQPALREILPQQPVLDAISFDGGTEAVAATYDQSARLVIVEYTTPQFAFDADAAITARIAGLRGEGRPVPSAYRRVGNYAVFVFDAPNEAAATGLIEKVKYEKDVRWLGEDPYAIGRANRAWLNMSTSVIVNTVKATGIAIAICLTIGGVLGGWVFMRRRAQAALSENFSDAGGMMRLNLDEMNVETNASRLIGQGDKVR